MELSAESLMADGTPTEHAEKDVVGKRLIQYILQLDLNPSHRAQLIQSIVDLEPDAAFDLIHSELVKRAGGEASGATLSEQSEECLLQGSDASSQTGERNMSVLKRDHRGIARLQSTPPLARASMKARPWDTGIFSRLGWRWRRKKAKAHAEASQSSATESNAGPDRAQHPWKNAGRIRRVVLLSFLLGQTWLATYFMTAILPYHGSHWLEMMILTVYAILFAWVGAGFWTALMGFLVLLRGKDRFSITASAEHRGPVDPEARTAILVPICNEDVTRVFAGIRATWESLVETGNDQAFDLYFLSDSSDADTRVAELQAWFKLCRDVDGIGRIFYRRRTHRVRRKSGNVADWCRRWGSQYRYMIVLDADSIMTGDCMSSLVNMMQANPQAGIIQSAPRAAGIETLYARIQQMATRIYGPLFTAGLHFWQLGESHYWGHNAILRVEPFMQHCALGKISGKGPLAGEILSHDFVEAALMRRAGWGVWIAYDLPGSFEEMPPSLLDELKRDRRWCQGNLQNFQLFTAKGLHPAHRAVFMTGVMAYLSAPLWFLFLLLSTALLAVNVLSEPVYFTEPHQLFPVWPQWHPEWAISLFGATATLLFLPKLLAALLLLIRRQELKGFGGGPRMLVSVALETLFSALLAPVRMLFHTRFVLGALLGLKLSWKSPPRGNNETGWREAMFMHGGGTLLGMAWAGLVYWLNPQFLWWLLPVVGSLMIAIPLSVWSSRIGLGMRFRRSRLFLIPEESLPPRVLRTLQLRLRKALRSPPGFRDAVSIPLLNALMCRNGIPRLRRPQSIAMQQNELLESGTLQGPESLDEGARNQLLQDPILLRRLHRKVWTQANAHQDWFGTAAQ